MLKITKGLNALIDNEITTYTDDEGNRYVRVKNGNEDFCIAATDYAKNDICRFTWDSAMKSLEYNGLTTLTKRQVAIYKAHLDEINSKLKEIGGTTLVRDWYWTSTECDADNASIYFGTDGNPDNFKKNYKFMVRPVLNLK